MARTKGAPEADREEILECVRRECISCGWLMWIEYENFRTVRKLNEVVRLRLRVRRCRNPECERYRKPYRPEVEGGWALPKHEFGLDVIAHIGALRYQEHQSVPEIHRELRGRGVEVSQRAVNDLLDRYDELLAISLGDDQRLREILAREGRVILSIDGLQPDVGHEVLWVLRDCLSGEILLARAMLSSSAQDLGQLLKEVRESLPVAIAGVISDGQHSLRKAVAQMLPGVPHGLCQFHYLREAAKPIYEADRHAKKELKKRVRGVRALERSVEQCQDGMGQVVQGYCAAVRSALTDDGRPPLAASGLKLHGRLTAIQGSLEGAGKRGRCPRSC